jgi:UDP-N-acetylmuramoyl-L-alanyl-D-glutamate--2,6-diaminopimelate ligase
MNGPTSRSLAELTFGLVDAPAEIRVTDITLDSRAASPGSLFLACRGRTHHGLDFAAQAVQRGARAVLFETGEGTARAPDFGSEIYVAGVPQLSRRVGTIADRFFGAPSKDLTVAGITGTNGKTTSAYLLAKALQVCGRPAAYAGTLGFGMPGALRPGTHTTADAVSVHRQLDALRRLGASCICMEVSSHALDQSRVDAVHFHTAVFTNLTRDHLDYHGTMAAYAAAKSLLLAWPNLAVRVINVDDAFGAELAARESTARLVVTTRQPPRGMAQFVRAARVAAGGGGLRIAIESSWGAREIAVPLIGDFNVDNVLTVLAVLLAWGVPLDAAAASLAECRPPSGRMETFGGGEYPLVIVDYAHTPDALAKALRAARMHCSGRLRVVFGCGGDRDAGKRPVMGAIAAELADDVVITDDNPRSEDPARIVADIRGGIDAARPVSVQHDRARAITGTMAAAVRGDVILIAGKGHEDYQIYGRESRPFSDQAVAREQLERQSCSAR